MPNYNKEKYIAEAIDSVIRQTFKEWELLILDDCSTDNSIEVIGPFLSDNRIKLLRNKQNYGLINVLKKLIKTSKSEIFGILDSDDVISEEAISIIYQEHTQNPDCGLIYTQFMYCDKNLKPVKRGYCDSVPLGKTNLQYDYVSHFKTFKKKYYYKTTGYDNKFECAEDKDIVFKMEEVSGILFVDKILYYYRVLSNSMSHNPGGKVFNKTFFPLAKYDAFNRRLDTDIPNLSDHEMSTELFFLASLYAKLKKFRKAIYYFLKAVGLKPLNYQGIKKFIGVLIRKG